MRHWSCQGTRWDLLFSSAFLSIVDSSIICIVRSSFAHFILISEWLLHLVQDEHGMYEALMRERSSEGLAITDVRIAEVRGGIFMFRSLLVWLHE